MLKDVRTNEGLVETAWCSCGFGMKTSGTQLRLKEICTWLDLFSSFLHRLQVTQIMIL